MKYLQTFRRGLSNLPGWRTNRKIIVFESDDWGTIRMPSQKVFESLQKKGVDLISGDSKRYNLYDTLATVDDLSALFEVLLTVKDKNSNPAVFTPVSLVANPDFEKIKADKFQKYHYEPFTDTLKRYHREDAFELWKEGIREKIFVPEFHGREHLNVQVWLRALQNNDKPTLSAFEHHTWGFVNRHLNRISYLSAFDLEFPGDVEYQKSVISEGLELFEKLHGYKSTFFVPPNGPFNSQLEHVSYENGNRYISSAKIRREPQGQGEFKKKYNWLGKKNKFGQRFITRNANFEPAKTGDKSVDLCLNDIAIAFKWHKPVTISSHRINYIGAIDPKNRDFSLKMLTQLLYNIVKTWPDVEFLTSAQLGNLISKPT